MSVLRPHASVSRIAPQLLSTRWTLIRERLRAEQLSGLICCGRGELHSYGAVEYVTGNCPWEMEVYSILGLSGVPVLLAACSGHAKAAFANVFCLTPLQLGEAFRAWTERLEVIGRVGFAAPNPEAVRNLLPDIELRDFTAELAAIKSVKLPMEIEQLQAVSDLTDEALAYFLRQIRIDIGSAPSRVEKMLAEHGARHSIVRLGAGPKFDQQPPTSEFVKSSLLCAYVEVLGANGYWVELMRPLAQASLDAGEKRQLDACSKVSDTAKALLRPGATGGRIYAAAANAAHAAGMRLDGACGHGLGIDDQDLPRLVPDDGTTLGNNMAVALHPRLVDDERGRGLVIGDTYVLSDSAPKRLSRFSAELITVQR
jgi:Xaa-Pro aminopeptidase